MFCLSIEPFLPLLLFRNKLTLYPRLCRTERIAEWTLAKLEQVLNDVSKLGGALKEAYDKACDVVQTIEGFAKDHPVLCTVIALGVLVLIAPLVLEALGFAELGPVEGEPHPIPC